MAGGTDGNKDLKLSHSLPACVSSLSLPNMLPPANGRLLPAHGSPKPVNGSVLSRCVGTELGGCGFGGLGDG